MARVLGPEPVDEPMRITGSAAWLQLGAVASLVIGAVVWSAIAEVPLKVTSKGVLLNERGVAEVVTANRGRIVELDVSPGETVKEGDLLAIVEQPELASQLAIRREQLAESRSHLQALIEFDRQLGNVQGASSAVRIASDRQRLRLLRERERVLAERDHNLQQLAGKGYASREMILRNDAELSSVREQIAALGGDVEIAGHDRDALGVQRMRELATTRSDIARLSAEVAELERKATSDQQLRSPYSGRVTEIRQQTGEFVEAGTPVVSLARSVWRDTHEEGELRAVVFAAPEQGKEIRRGMTVDLAPAGVKSNEYGFIVGKVMEVADAPASTGGMMHVLKNDQLVRQLSAQGPPFQVVVSLERADTPSGYRWTSSNGPKVHIDAGAPVEAQFVTRKQRLLGLVIPPLARLLAD